MTIANGQVTGDQKDPGVTPPVTAEVSEVPSLGTPAPVTSDAPTVDLAAIQSQLQKLEQDRRNQQGVYDRKLAEAERAKRELQEQLEAIRLQGMDEAQRKEYEATKWKTEYENLQRSIQEREAVQEYAHNFAEAFGIPVSKLDTSSQEAIAQSGWQAVIELVNELRQKSNPAPAAPAPTPAASPNKPRVLTGSGGVPTTRPTADEMKQAVARQMGRTAITNDEYYTFLERNPHIMNEWLSRG